MSLARLVITAVTVEGRSKSAVPVSPGLALPQVLPSWRGRQEIRRLVITPRAGHSVFGDSFRCAVEEGIGGPSSVSRTPRHGVRGERDFDMGISKEPV
jgi:hypothetical protein